MLFHRLQRIPPSLLHDVRRGGSWRSVEVQFGTLQRQKDKRAARGIGQLHQVAKILKRSQWYGQKLLKFGKMSSTCTGYLKKVLNWRTWKNVFWDVLNVQLVQTCFVSTCNWSISHRCIDLIPQKKHKRNLDCKFLEFSMNRPPHAGPGPNLRGKLAARFHQSRHPASIASRWRRRWLLIPILMWAWVDGWIILGQKKKPMVLPYPHEKKTTFHQWVYQCLHLANSEMSCLEKKTMIDDDVNPPISKDGKQFCWLSFISKNLYPFSSYPMKYPPQKMVVYW